jgi:hypothetical protein
MNPKLAESGKPDLKIPLSTIAKFSGGTNASSESSELRGGETSATACKDIWPLELELSSFMMNLAPKMRRVKDESVRVKSDSWDLRFEGSVIVIEEETVREKKV